MTPLIRFETFRPSGDPNKDIQELARLLAIAHDHIYQNLPDGTTVEFTSGDTPAKTVTVTRGVITSAS